MTRHPIRSLCLAAALCLAACLASAPASAHPHAFVEVFVTYVFDAEGLSGVKERWVLDEMLTVTVMDLIEENHDGKLSQAEIDKIREMSFGNLKGYDYFTTMAVDGRPFKVEWATDFDAAADKGKLIYSFFVPCHVAATDRFKEVATGVFDQTFYTFVSYGVEGEKGIDPNADPLFADPSVPANPGDYKRFAEAVGLEAFTGEVRVEGDTKAFVIEKDVREEPDWAFFHGQIVPEILAVRFKKR